MHFTVQHNDNDIFSNSENIKVIHGNDNNDNAIVEDDERKYI